MIPYTSSASGNQVGFRPAPQKNRARLACVTRLWAGVMFIMLAMPAGAIAAPKSAWCTFRVQSDFQAGQMDGVLWHSGKGNAGAGGRAGLVLNASEADRRRGVWTSPVLRTEFPFNDAVPSWNAETPDGTAVRIEIRAGDGQGHWTAWYRIAVWGRLSDDAVPHRRDADGSVDADTLVLSKSWTHLQLRMVLISDRPDVTPTLYLAAVVYANTRQSAISSPLSVSAPSEWAKDLPVPFRSQQAERPDLAYRICAPTSLAMVLEYHGKNLPTERVCELAFDLENGIYGNWPYNAAVAGRLGFESYVVRFAGFEAIQAEIAAGRPVIISIRFRKGELSGVPIQSTDGHLLVVRGFTEQGDVIVNDPAARTEVGGHIVYKRDELLRAWKNGVAILVRPL